MGRYGGEGLGVTVKVTGLDPDKVSRRILSPVVKLAIANSALPLMQDYVPEREGVLMQSAQPMIENESAVIYYPGPYAHKHYTDASLNHSKATATAEWDQTMLNAKGDQFIKTAEEIIQNGG